MSPSVSRRQALALAAGTAGTWLAAPRQIGAAESESAPFRYCFNTGTVLGKQVDLVSIIDSVARAGYDGIELWIREVDQYLEDGGSLGDLRKRLEDAGLILESAISFPAWGADDPDQRRNGLEQIEREMEVMAELGGTRIAAPPAGINRAEPIDLRALADRYRAVLELGEKTGVTPQLEIWGTSTNLGRLSEAVFVLVEVGHPRACGLFDVYHLFRGGSSFEGLRQLNGAQMQVFHINDYPAEPAREAMNDSHRVMPGDGVAPLDQILRTLYETGFRGALSLELFNREIWQRDLDEVTRTGLQKIRAAAERALG